MYQLGAKYVVLHTGEDTAGGGARRTAGHDGRGTTAVLGGHAGFRVLRNATITRLWKWCVVGGGED